MALQSQGFSGLDISRDTWELILGFPLASPPKGVVADFATPKFHGNSSIITSAICLTVLVSALLLRIYSKARLVKRFTLDDYIYLISWSAGIAYCCLCLGIATGGFYGYHMWDLRIGSMTRVVTIRMQVMQSMSGALYWLLKLCLFSLILVAFAPLKWTKTLVYAGVIVSGMAYAVPVISLAIACRPRDGTDQIAYLAGMASVQCGKLNGMGQKMGILFGVVNLTSDLYLLALPIPAIRSLQVSSKKRLGIYCVYMAAIAGCVVSAVVLVLRIRLKGTGDITYALFPLYIACQVEVTIGLLIPCAGTFAAIYRHCRSQSDYSTTATSYRNLRDATANKSAWSIGQRRKSSVEVSKNSHVTHAVVQSWSNTRLNSSDDLDPEMQAPAAAYDPRTM